MEINSALLNISEDNSDNISILSDITDTVTQNVDETELDINAMFENKLQKMNVEELKEKCKENFIIGVSKSKKSELIQLLLNTFTNIWIFLKQTKLQQLRDIYKTNKIKDKYSNGSSKKHIIYNIMNYNSKCETLQFIKYIKCDTFQKNNQSTDEDITEKLRLRDEEELKDKPRLQKETELKEKLRLQKEAELNEKRRLQEEAELNEKLRLQEEA
jgi:hypothetical protein